MLNQPIHIVFAGGGTGGHLFPTLAVAERLEGALGAGTTCRFLCSSRAIDASILGRVGVEFTRVPAAPPSVRPRALLRFLRGWGPSVRAARFEIRKARAAGKQVVLVASGGFVAAPLAQGARVEKCPVLMLNLDAVPGKANRWIARFADRILTTARVCDSTEGVMDAGPEAALGRRSGSNVRGRGVASWTRIRPIVRRSISTSAPAEECRRSFGLDPSRRTLLVTGGSQGAASINRFMGAFVEKHADALRGWQVIHQTGGQGSARDADKGEVGEAYREAGIASHVTEFLADMGLAWGAADLCVCRAGAGNVGEAWATRTPCVFMPYPFHKDGHQRANALPLVEAGAGVLVHDAIEPEANLEEAGMALAELLRDDAARGRLEAGLRGLGPADGAERVVEVIGILLSNETA